MTEEMNVQMNGYVHLIDRATSGRRGGGGGRCEVTEAKPHTDREAGPAPNLSLLL